jgi:hypothetical protein
VFLENKYTKWYNTLISNAKTRKIDSTQTYEKHHIIPKCLGGDNTSENLVKLFPKEHYIAHLLLTRMIEGPLQQKLYFAWWRMMHSNNRTTRYKPGNRAYHAAKSAMVLRIKAQNKGQIVTSAQREKFRNKVPWNKGKKMSNEFCKNLSAIRKVVLSTTEARQTLSQQMITANKLKSRSGPTTRPRFRWVLKNLRTSQLITVTNLKQWCIENKVSQPYLYTSRKCEWMILEKYRLKNNEKII